MGPAAEQHGLHETEHPPARHAFLHAYRGHGPEEGHGAPHQTPCQQVRDRFLRRFDGAELREELHSRFLFCGARGGLVLGGRCLLHKTVASSLDMFASVSSKPITGQVRERSR